MNAYITTVMALLDAAGVAIVDRSAGRYACNTTHDGSNRSPNHRAGNNATNQADFLGVGSKG
jgi:hypothetical protein